MVKAELIKRSPLRIMEKSTRGGVEAGNLGIIASPRGVGKTACLVHIATDKLLQGKHVVHLSFAGKTDHIIDWYEAIFKEIATKRELDAAVEIHDELVKNRVILNYSQHDVSIDHIEKSIEALIGEGHFAADLLVIDGYDFSKGSIDTFKSFKKFAAKHNLTIWATADIAKKFRGNSQRTGRF
jgi:KaiC/GvpD/RAD55 family RecA-like ATPase